MSTYSVLHAFFMTWFSKDFYRDVRQNWSVGKGFAALLLVLALAWLPLTYGLYRSSAAFAQKHVGPLINQIPELVLKDGQVSLTASQPVFIKLSEAEQPLAIIDTTGKIKSLELYPETHLLVAKDYVIMRKSGNRIESVPIGPKVNVTLTRERFHGWMMKALGWLPFLLYPIALFTSMVYRLVQALIYAALGSLLAGIQKIDLDYAVIFKLTMVSLIPAILFKLMISVFRVGLPLQWVFGLALGVGYMIFALRANQTESI